VWPRRAAASAGGTCFLCMIVRQRVADAVEPHDGHSSHTAQGREPVRVRVGPDGLPELGDEHVAGHRGPAPRTCLSAAWRAFSVRSSATVPGCISSTETVRWEAVDFGSSVAVRFPFSKTRPAWTTASPRSRSMASQRMPRTLERRGPAERQPPRRCPLVCIGHSPELDQLRGYQTSTGLESLCCFLGTLTWVATLTAMSPDEMP
jgi:hypothetical protein